MSADILGYVDGTFVPAQSLSVNIDDIGFARGLTVFELFRVYEGGSFMMEEHLQRLERGLQRLGLKPVQSMEEIEGACHTLIERHNFPNSVIKIYVTGGETDPWGGLADTLHPHVFIKHVPFEPHSKEYPIGPKPYEEGLACQTVDRERTIPEVKTTDYLNGFDALSQAKAAGFDEILYVNRKGNVPESLTSNLFLVRDGKLITPKEGMLLGLTRHKILQLAEGAGIEVELRDIPRAELMDPAVTGAFLSSSTKEIPFIKQVDDRDFGMGAECDMYQRVRKLFLDSLPQ